MGAMAKYLLNEAAVAKARELIDARQYVLDSDWGEVQPRADAQNDYLESHSWDEYAEWHLGLTEGATDETKARYAFVYGDFRRVHRTGLIACVYRASEWRHKDVELAAHELLQYLDRKTGLEPTRKGNVLAGLPTQDEVHDSLSQLDGCVLAGARGGQDSDTRCEQDRRPQIGLLRLESEVDKGLSDRSQYSAVTSLDTCQHRFVGQRPDAHRPFECPVIGAHQRLHHHRQTFTGIDVGHVLEPSPTLVVEVAPRVGKSVAIRLHVGEVPVKAALGDVQPFAEPLDPQRVRAAIREKRESGLYPIVGRQLAARNRAPAS